MSVPEFDLNFLNDLLSQPERTSGPRKIKDVRDMEHWFRLFHNLMGRCSNEECIAEALGVFNQFSGERQGRDRVTAIVNDHEMCRFCYIDGWHYTP